MDEEQKLASELVDYVAVVDSKNGHIQCVAKRLLELVTPVGISLKKECEGKRIKLTTQEIDNLIEKIIGVERDEL